MVVLGLGDKSQRLCVVEAEGAVTNTEPASTVPLRVMWTTGEAWMPYYGQR